MKIQHKNCGVQKKQYLNGYLFHSMAVILCYKVTDCNVKIAEFL